MVSSRARWLALIGAVAGAVVIAAAVNGCEEDEPEALEGALVFRLGQEVDVFFPWRGYVKASSLRVEPGGRWTMDHDLLVDMSNLKLRPNLVQGLVLVVVGEPVFDRKGAAQSLVATSFTTRFTTTGVPLAWFPGALPVRALGSRHGSPLEGTREVPAGPWTRGGEVRIQGRLTIDIPRDLPAGYYRPHVEIFARIKGSNTPVDLGQLAAVLNIADTPWDRLSGGFWHKYLRLPRPNTLDFMDGPQVLPDIEVGRPARPHMPWSIFHERETHGMSGLLPVERHGEVALLNRVHLPTPYRLRPGIYHVNPGLPTLAPRGGLAGLFVDRGGPVVLDRNYLDLSRGWARASLTGPGGAKTELGQERLSRLSQGGVYLEHGGFRLDLQQTGDYELHLVGEMYSKYRHHYSAGGTYRFTVAQPLSFSTAVKPGTSFLVGATYPAVLHLNPGVPAYVRLEVVYYPRSDPKRARRVVHEGKASRYGHFVAARPWMRFSEPGEYISRFEARYRDASGVLWMGAQSSSGVVAPQKPVIRLHGGKTRLAADPRGRWRARFDGADEATCDPRHEPPLPGDDFVLPYLSGDTLLSAVTYPFESTVSNVLTMEVTRPALAARLARAFNPTGAVYNYLDVSHGGEVSYLPHAVRFSLDDRGHYSVSSKRPQQMPILFANRKGLAPLLYPEHNEVETYAYLSVIRPGFQVLTLAYTGSSMQPYWVVSPAALEGESMTRPVGDLAGDVYRIMGGLVLKDLKSGDVYHDAYASAIANITPGYSNMSVAAPGRRPLMVVNGRPQRYFMGMDTSVILKVGDPMVLAGTVMPPVAANVRFTVTRPDGRVEVIRGRSNRLGQFSPPRPVAADLPGVYRVKARIERQGVTGDVPGTGDGEFYNFVVPHGGARLLRASLPPVSRAGADRDLRVTLSWPRSVSGVTITHSLNMPGLVLDEGRTRAHGQSHDYVLRLSELAVQYPFLETVHHGTGKREYADTIVIVLFMEGRQGGEKVHDALRLIFRRGRLFYARAMFPSRGEAAGPDLFPKKRTFFADP